MECSESVQSSDTLLWHSQQCHTKDSNSISSRTGVKEAWTVSFSHGMDWKLRFVWRWFFPLVLWLLVGVQTGRWSLLAVTVCMRTWRVIYYHFHSLLLMQRGNVRSHSSLEERWCLTFSWKRERRRRNAKRGCSAGMLSLVTAVTFSLWSAGGIMKINWFNLQVKRSLCRARKFKKTFQKSNSIANSVHVF